MPSPLPRRIDLGFAIITIRYARSRRMREEAECEDDDPTPEGLWDTDTDTMWILRQNTRKMRNCILHELVHAALDLRDGDVR